MHGWPACRSRRKRPAKTRAIRDQVGGVSKKAEGDALAELRTLGDKIKADVTAIEETLYQTKNKSGQDPLNFPIRLNDKLGNVLSVVSAGDNAPTQQAIAVKAELTLAIDAELDKLNALVSLDLSKFNRLAAEAGIPHVLVEEKAKYAAGRAARPTGLFPVVSGVYRPICL